MSASPVVSKVKLCLAFEVPGRGITVQLNQDLVEGLYRETTQNLMLRQAGISGLLIGRIDGQDEVTITVETNRPAANGESEALVLPNKLERWTNLRAGRSAVLGAYHIENGEALAPPPALIDHFRTSFSGLHSVFLLIRPSGASTPPIAGLFVGSPGQDPGDVADLRFLFDPQQLNRAPEPVIAEPAEMRYAAVDAPSPATRPQPKIEQRAPVPAAAQKETGRGLRIAVLAGILTVIAAGAYLVPKLIFRAAVQPQSGAVATFGTSHRLASETGTLGMKVNIETGGLRITWDQKSPAALSAVHGTLQIRDGQKFRDVSLNQAEIQHGNVVYVPQSDDLDLRLELIASDMTRYTDYIKVVGSAMPESGANPQSREPVISLPPVSSKSPPSAARRQNGRSRTVAKPFTPPQTASRRPVPQPSLPAPPQLTDAERDARITNPGPLTASHIASPQLPVPDKPASAPVSPVSAPSGNSLQPTAQRVISKVTDPVLRKKTAVNLPSDLRKLAGNMIVVVRVTIDSDGHVLRSQPMGDKAGFKHNIASIVANSVRNWEFKPAEADGKPVRSDFDLQVAIRADGALRQ